MDDINKALDAIREFKETYNRYCQDGTARPISTHYMLYAAEQCTNLRIELKTVPVAGVHIKSRLQRFAEHADIVYPDKLNDCWARMAIAKEIVHLLCDTESSFVSTADDAIDLVANLIRPIPPVASMPLPLKSEHMAVHLALEILFPVSERGYYVDQVGKNLLGAYDVAVMYKIPQRFVELVLDPEMHELYLKLVKAEN